MKVFNKPSLRWSLQFLTLKESYQASSLRFLSYPFIHYTRKAIHQALKVNFLSREKKRLRFWKEFYSNAMCPIWKKGL